MQVKAYYTGREKRKGGMDVAVFDMVAWDDVKFTPKRTSKILKMWHAKQGSESCGVGYWTNKREKSKDSRCLRCTRLNETADHLNQCQTEVRTAVCVDQTALLEEWRESTYTSEPEKLASHITWKTKQKEVPGP